MSDDISIRCVMHQPNILTLRLQISVDEAHQMQILQSGCHFCCIESGIIFVNTFIGARLQCPKELSAAAIFHA